MHKLYVKLTVWPNIGWTEYVWLDEVRRRPWHGATTAPGVIYIRNFSHFCRSSSSNWGDWEFTNCLFFPFFFEQFELWKWQRDFFDKKRREYCSGFSILIGCFILGLFDPLFSLAYFSVSPPNSPLVLAKCATMPDKRQRDNTRALAFIRWEDWENNCFVLKVTRFFCFCSWCEAMFCNMIPH